MRSPAVNKSPPKTQEDKAHKRIVLIGEMHKPIYAKLISRFLLRLKEEGGKHILLMEGFPALHLFRSLNDVVSPVIANIDAEKAGLSDVKKKGVIGVEKEGFFVTRQFTIYIGLEKEGFVIEGLDIPKSLNFDRAYFEILLFSKSFKEILEGLEELSSYYSILLERVRKMAGLNEVEAQLYKELGEKSLDVTKEVQDRITGLKPAGEEEDWDIGELALERRKTKSFWALIGTFRSLVFSHAIYRSFNENPKAHIYAVMGAMHVGDVAGHLKAMGLGEEVEVVDFTEGLPDIPLSEEELEEYLEVTESVKGLKKGMIKQSN